MNDIEKAIEHLERYRYAKGMKEEFLDLAISALEKQKVFKSADCSLEEVVARNLIAWETSKDKREGLLPEVYLTNLFLFRKLTGLDPTIPNLRKIGNLD